MLIPNTTSNIAPCDAFHVCRAKSGDHPGDLSHISVRHRLSSAAASTGAGAEAGACAAAAVVVVVVAVAAAKTFFEKMNYQVI